MRNRIRSTLLVTAALAVSLSAIGVSSAMATPKGEYAVFAQCPTSNPELSGCLVSRTESGHITMGKTEVPIVKTQTLQGGLINIEPGLKKMAAALNGETLTKTPQKVPGGLLGLVKCNEIKGEGIFEKLERGACELIFENSTTGVNATTELAAPASSVLLSLAEAELETGPALVLPIKVKLENPLLGKECYIGSNAHPIVLELTTGTSGTLKGKLGEISTKAEGGILAIKNNTLVNGTFSAPAATGCGEFFSFLLDPIINSKIGLPATSGNSAVLNSTLEIANSELVKESEEL
jgi:hypothetical protein